MGPHQDSNRQQAVLNEDKIEHIAIPPSFQVQSDSQ